MSTHDIIATVLLIGLMVAGIPLAHLLVWLLTPDHECGGWHAHDPKDFEL